MGCVRGTGRVATAIATVLLVGALVAGGAGTAAAASESPPVGVYADDSGTLVALRADGTTTSLGVQGTIVGPTVHLDGDDALEVPFVTDAGDLRVVELDGDVATLVDGDLPSGNDYVSTGDWDGDGNTAVFYENTSDGNLYKFEVGEGAQLVTGPDGDPLATNGAVGVARFDDTPGKDLLFLGSSGTLKYDNGSGVGTTGFSSFSANNGVGLGAPADFDGDGVARVPILDGSGHVSLIDDAGAKTRLNATYKPAKAPLAAADWTGDGDLEVLHVDDGGRVAYVALNGTVEVVRDPQGDPLAATKGVGVAPVFGALAPRVSNYTVSNPSGRVVRVGFDSSERLANVSVAVDGPDGATATLADGAFDERGSGPYRYVANYTAPADGDYAATLRRAIDGQGYDGAEGQNGSVAVRTPTPTVESVTLADATGGDGLVAGGDRVRVAATVANRSALRSIEANASAFGAGSVALSRVGDGRYAATFGVDEANASGDGATSLSAVATNEFGHADANRSGTLFLDTTPPDADAGPDVAVDEGTVVVFDGDGSTDDSGVVRYVWSFGDGNGTTGTTATHTYATPGTYTATLTAYDAANHSATDTRVVEVRDVSGGDTRVRTVTETETVYVDDASDSNDTRVVYRSVGPNATTVSLDRLSRTAVRSWSTTREPGGRRRSPSTRISPGVTWWPSTASPSAPERTTRSRSRSARCRRRRRGSRLLTSRFGRSPIWSSTARPPATSPPARSPSKSTPTRSGTGRAKTWPSTGSGTARGAPTTRSPPAGRTGRSASGRGRRGSRRSPWRSSDRRSASATRPYARSRSRSATRRGRSRPSRTAGPPTERSPSRSPRTGAPSRAGPSPFPRTRRDRSSSPPSSTPPGTTRSP